MKTSKYPFKVKKGFCKYSVEFFEKKYIMYKSDAYRKTCWVMEESTPYKPVEMQYKWFGCKKLSIYLDMLKLIYEHDVATLKDLTARLLESLKLEGGENGQKETK